MEIIQTVVDWYMANLNYLTVVLLMTIESSFIPFPSEVVIPFAAYKAAQGGLNVFGVVIAGTVGALAGATDKLFPGTISWKTPGLQICRF